MPNLNQFAYKYLIIVVLLFAETRVSLAAENVIGWVENISINHHEIQFEAKIDTGADVTSINAEIIEIYRKNNREWIKFRIENKQGEQLELEKQIVRYAQIKRKQAKPVERPVITLDICLQKTRRTVEVNLSKREHFKYKMLIGRNYLKDAFLVDSGRVFVTEPICR